MLSFPCQFSFKIIGHANNQFEGEVLRIVRQHFPQLGEGAITQKYSKNGKYLAFTVRVFATSQPQLDALYEELSSNSHVLFVI